MQDDQTQPPQVPIDYRDPAADRPAAVRNRIVLATGAFLGVALTSFVGFVGVLASLEIDAHHRERLARGLPAAVAFLIVSAVATVTGVYLLGKPARDYRLAGFLLGIGVTCLCEGLCFNSIR